MVIKNEDACVRILFSIKVRGREAAKASSDDNEIVEIGIGLLDGPPVAPTVTRKLVGDFEGSDMIAAQPDECWRIAGSSPASALQREHLIRERSPGNQRARRQCAHSVQQISARNGAIHSEVAICGVHGISPPRGPTGSRWRAT